MAHTYLIQPFRQRIIWRDPLERTNDISCLEYLNEDLSYNSTEFSYRGTPEDTLIQALATGVARPEGWVRIETDRPFYEFKDIWPQAIKKLGTGKAYSPLTEQL